MRYWLKVPKWKTRQASRAGCRWSLDYQQWYIEEPFKQPFNLSDFLSWTPSENPGHYLGYPTQPRKVSGL